MLYGERMKKSRLIPLVTGATAVVAVAAVAGGSALASGSHSASVSASATQATVQAGQTVGGSLNASSGVTAAAVARSDAALSSYWTPARMRHARSADKVSSPSNSATPAAAVATGAPESVAPSAPAGRTLAAAAAKSTVSKAAGKVFFSDDGADWVCSGSVISAHRLNVVSTAGHCVIDAGANHYHSNWIFVPDYRNGSAPYGVWGGAYARTSTGWAKHGEFGYDAAFVNVHDLKGKHLQNVVGGEGILVNQGYKPYMTVIGYPQAKPYNGATQQFCYGYGHRYYKTLQVELGCHLTGGASGGPWMRWFKNGYGYVDGVSSNKNSNNNKDVRSPYFATWTWKMYKLSA
jgi:V8-like Glu-specific endopeptidase